MIVVNFKSYGTELSNGRMENRYLTEGKEASFVNLVEVIHP